MKLLAPVPLVLSALIMAAHFYRAGQVAVATIVLIAPLLLVTRELAAVRVLQLLLVLGAGEWMRTAYVIAQHRAAAGEPFTRMLVILGAVAVVTLLSAWPLPVLARRPTTS